MLRIKVSKVLIQRIVSFKVRVPCWQAIFIMIQYLYNFGLLDFFSYRGFFCIRISINLIEYISWCLTANLSIVFGSQPMIACKPF